ncbi:MAG: hypothetical protein JST54_34600 [Deltaproteobacteria bacterium]|nr:hypothetical protein [Deltaproteobacteria bacterium]
MRIQIHPEDIEAARHGIRRSAEWPRVEKLHLQLQPKCLCCSPEMRPHAGVQVHHIFPFHYCIALGRPDLELDLRNLVTLCEDEEGKPGENHHLLVGHFDSFRSSNLNVLEDAQGSFHGKCAEEIRKSARWLELVSQRLKPLGEMSQQDKDEFARLMNARYPRRLAK